jgi:putative ABC transport system permease protein
MVPFGTADRGTEFFMEGQPDLPARGTPVAALNHVTSRYGETLHLRQVRGRLLNAADAAEAPKVAMINETLARRYFSGRDPIGQGLRLRRESQDVWRIVGIVAEVKNYETTDASEPQIYVPFAQQPVWEMTVVVRASGDPEALAGTVRHAVAALDPREPVSRVFTMEALIVR